MARWLNRSFSRRTSIASSRIYLSGRDTLIADTYLVRLWKDTAVDQSEGLFEHDSSTNKDNLPLQ